MARDKTKVQIVEYDFIFDNEDVGYTQMDQTVTELGLKYVKVEDSAQFKGIVAVSKTGAAPTLKVVMLQTAFDSILGKIAKNQMYPIVDGAKLGWGLGARQVNLFNEAKVCRLHPTGTDAADYSADIMYWLGAPNLEAVKYGGMRDKEQTVEVPFFILPDDTKSLDLTYGIFGDWTAVEAAPYSIFLNTESNARAPYNHDTALTLSSYAKKQIYAHGFYKTNSTVTAAINEAGNITSTDRIWDFDTLSTSNALAVGDFILVGTEVMRIAAITYATGTTGTLTTDRHIGGTVAASALDNAVITKLSNCYSINVTNRATWVSTAADDVTVGDSNVLGNKGTIEWVADGSDTIAATVLTTTSPNLTVTALA